MSNTLKLMTIVSELTKATLGLEVWLRCVIIYRAKKNPNKIYRDSPDVKNN